MVTVAELIAALQKLDPGLPVHSMFPEDGGHFVVPADRVTLCEDDDGIAGVLIE